MPWVGMDPCKLHQIYLLPANPPLITIIQQYLIMVRIVFFLPFIEIKTSYIYYELEKF